MLFLGSERFNIPLGHIWYDCYELCAYLKVEQINFDIQFWKQCCSVMHDWRNFNDVSFESIMIILYDKSMATVIHPGTWSQQPFISGFCFFWDALYTTAPTQNLSVSPSLRTVVNVSHISNNQFKLHFVW